MEQVLKMDIFFFISSVSVIIITVVLIIASYYLIKILKNFSEISSILKKATKDGEEEIRELGEQVRESPIFSFIFGKKKRSKHTK